MKQRWLVRNGADIGESIKEIRMTHGKTQEQLAQELGVDRTRLAKLERGHTTIVLDLLIRLLQGMGAFIVVEFDDTPPGGTSAGD